MSEKTKITLTVDVEGEWFELPGEQGYFDIDKIVSAVEHLEALLDRIETDRDIHLPVTWFVRCDDSVAKASGDPSGLLKALSAFIDRRSSKGDEFGLHPHLYRFNKGKWESETDPEKQKSQIERAAIAWKSFFGVGPKLSRMGEALMNDTVAHCLNRIGVEADASALSGRKRFDSGFQFDWLDTPSTPYCPSAEDYRIPAEAGNPELKFVELPFTMLPIKGPDDREPIKRYFNLAFKPDLIKDALGRTDRMTTVISVVHPHELQLTDQAHSLISYHPDSLEENISNICNFSGNYEFVLLSSCLNDND
ncbi:hypothetical protein ACFL2V_01230 [Pseudomonadota bacterium]